MDSLNATSYAVHFGQNGYQMLNELIAQGNYSTLFILTETTVYDQCLPQFVAQLATETPIEILEVEAGEGSKTIATCVELWESLNELGGDRKSLLINIGGGMITDLGGFVASTYKRGIDFLHIPTTLLSMVDAAIGGKNGVDLGHIKNQIGTISPPKMVVIDCEFLTTLPSNHMRAGLAEMLKHGLIASSAHWNELANLNELTSDDLERLIADSIQIKLEIVAKDPAEKRERKMLNFGHTLGHAIESHFLATESLPVLLHGECVAAGMWMEAHIAKELNLLKAEDFISIANRIDEIFPKLPLDSTHWEQITNLLIFDKKNEHGQILFSLLEGIGKGNFNQIVANHLIDNAFKEYVQ